ncbi:MAG: ABC transporter permease [Coriobacteriia bacterium]|nr:ABC transporter permease [Coriobacteriia bacterium]
MMKLNSKVRAFFGYLLALLILFVGWHVSSLILNSPALPTPIETIPVFIHQLSSLAPHFVISAYRVVISILIGMVLAVPIALLLSRNEKTDAIFAPFLFLSYPIPKVVLLPVLLVIFGLGNLPKIMLISLTVFFQVLMSMRDAALQVNPSYIASVQSLGANSWEIYRHVIVPAVMPNLFATLRIASGTAIAILFIAESMAGTTGLGYVIINAWGLIDYPQMFAAIIAMAMLGVLIYEIIASIERKITAWTKAGQA